MKTLAVLLLLFVYSPTFAQSNAAYCPDSLSYYRAEGVRKDTTIVRLEREKSLLSTGIEHRQNKTAGLLFVSVLLVVASLVQELVR